jgi:hypothetical protein
VWWGVLVVVLEAAVLVPVDWFFFRVSGVKLTSTNFCFAVCLIHHNHNTHALKIT